MSLARPRTYQALTNIAHGLRQGLVAYWTLEESSGSRIGSIEGLSLTDNNTVTQQDGKRGKCAEFVLANTEYLSIATNATVQLNTGSWTISCWAYLADATTTSFGGPLGKGSSTLREYEIYYGHTTDQWHAVVGDGGTGSADATSTVTVTSGTWFHILAYHDKPNKRVSIRVNLESEKTASSAAFTAADGTSEFRIGRSGQGALMTGRVDEVGIWKRLLTSEEHSWLYNNGAGRTYPF